MAHITKRQMFFATEMDLVQLITSVEHELPVDFVRMGSSTSSVAQRFSTVMSLPNLGHATSDAAATSDEYLIVLKGHPVVGRRVEGNDGVTRYFFDQLANEASITFSPGGLRGSDVLLHGRVATASDDEISQSLMKHFAKALRSSFRKIKAYWVGPEAEALLDAGKRLTISVRASREFDLTRTA